jgi:hypothetical protein
MTQREDECPVIRASDIGGYVFCHRAWWYGRQGYAPANVHELRRGQRRHLRHGVLMRAVTALSVIAVLLIISGMVLAALYFLQLAAGTGG